MNAWRVTMVDQRGSEKQQGKAHRNQKYTDNKNRIYVWIMNAIDEMVDE